MTTCRCCIHEDYMRLLNETRKVSMEFLGITKNSGCIGCSKGAVSVAQVLAFWLECVFIYFCGWENRFFYDLYKIYIIYTTYIYIYIHIYTYYCRDGGYCLGVRGILVKRTLFGCRPFFLFLLLFSYHCGRVGCQQEHTLYHPLVQNVQKVQSPRRHCFSSTDQVFRPTCHPYPSTGTVFIHRTLYRQCFAEKRKVDSHQVPRSFEPHFHQLWTTRVVQLENGTLFP